MQTDLHHFLTRMAGAAAITLLPVVITAFLTMPYSLHRHSDEHPADPYAPVAHMT